MQLTELTKQKTAEVDNLLGELQETVRQSQPVKKDEPVQSSKKETKQEKIDKFKKNEENSKEALEKLNKMEF